MKAAELFCHLLEEKGVRHMFGLFGDIQVDFAQAISKSKIKWIHVHNEKSGGFMADIYSRVSGRPGVVFSTLGPGATNLTSALANATQDRVPLIGISDQVNSKEFDLETHQFLDLARAFNEKTGITKKTFVVKDVKDLPKIVDMAFEVSTAEPKGSVHISFPADLYCQEVPKSLLKASIVKKKNTQIKYPKSSVTYKEILQRLYGNKRCLVIAGGSIERSDAKKEFTNFVEKFNLPVLTSFRGKNILPVTHPNSLGTVSRHLGDVLQELIKSVDFLLLVGYDYNEGVKPSLWGKTKVININSFDNRVKKIFTPPSYFGDLKSFFDSLSKQKKPEYKDSFDFINTKSMIKQIIEQALDIKNKNMHPRKIIDAVNEVFKKDAIIVCDIGINKYYSGLMLEPGEGKQILFSNGQSAMAFTSGALGAKIADPKKDVVVLVGDGGFLMDPQEVLTSVANKQNLIWIIFNNGSLGLVEQAQFKVWEKPHGVYFSKVFFTKLAQAFGIDGIHITSKKDIKEILEYYKASKKSVIIDVPVEYATRKH